MARHWINQPPQIWTIQFCPGQLSPLEPHYLTFSKERRGEWQEGLEGMEMEEEAASQEGPSPVPLDSHQAKKGNVKREAQKVVSTAQSGRQHRGGLCPPSLSANYSPSK